MPALTGRNGLESVAQIVLDNGADIHVKDNSGRMALYWAALSSYNKQ